MTTNELKKDVVRRLLTIQESQELINMLTSIVKTTKKT
jgi:hypothetical protein